MNSNFVVRNTTLTVGMKAYIDKKFSHFEKYLDKNDIVNVKIEISKAEDKPCKVEVTIPNFDGLIRAEHRSDDVYISIDKVEESITRSLRKRKEKRIQKHRKTSDQIGYIEANDKIKIVREKQHELESMTQEEACEAMAMTDHSFYVYLDSEKRDAVCAVYVREDGQYGLLIFK